MRELHAAARGLRARAAGGTALPSSANSQTLSPRVVPGKNEPADSATTYCARCAQTC